MVIEIQTQNQIIDNEIEQFPCQCGCGKLAPPGEAYIPGHDKICSHYRHWIVEYPKIASKPEPQLCECGCGEYAKPGKRFVFCHQNRIRKYLTGDYLTNAQKRQYENMRGGGDIVEHHYLYDHSDLSLNTVKMTRSNHSRLHNLLLRLGVSVPHINIRSK